MVIVVGGIDLSGYCFLVVGFICEGGCQVVQGVGVEGGDGVDRVEWFVIG